jgi:hypothetical protein
MARRPATRNNSPEQFPQTEVVRLRETMRAPARRKDQPCHPQCKANPQTKKWQSRALTRCRLKRRSA